MSQIPQTYHMLVSQSSSNPLSEMPLTSGSEGVYLLNSLVLGRRKMPVGMKVSMLNSMMNDGISLRYITYWYQQEQFSRNIVQNITRKVLTELVSDWSLPQQATKIVISPMQIRKVNGKQLITAPPNMLFTFSFNRPRFSTNILPKNTAKSFHIPNSASYTQIAISMTDSFTGVRSQLKNELSPSQATNTTKRMKLKPQSIQLLTSWQYAELSEVTVG